MDNLALGSSKIIMFNLTDDLLLYEKNADVETAIASLTKIMTTIITLENKQLDEAVTITDDMLTNLNEFAVIGLIPGQTLTVEELLYATMLPSAGDAAQALAISTAGSIGGFAEKMNQKANELGMSYTHFNNAAGQDENNYSTARDIAILTKYALKNPEFRKIFTTFEYNINSLGETVNKTVPDNTIIAGAKTGFTYGAGRCLSSIADFSDAEFLLVNLNADWTTNNHITDALSIYNYYAENYSYRNVLNAGEKILDLAVFDSEQKNYEVVAHEDVKKYLKNDLEIASLKRVYNGEQEIHKGKKSGDYLGNYQIYNNEDLIYEMPVYLEQEIEFYPYWLWNTGVVIGGLLLIGCLITIFRKTRQSR